MSQKFGGEFFSPPNLFKDLKVLKDLKEKGSAERSLFRDFNVLRIYSAALNIAFIAPSCIIIRMS